LIARSHAASSSTAAAGPAPVPVMAAAGVGGGRSRTLAKPCWSGQVRKWMASGVRRPGVGKLEMDC
jgi:hypothetical protein